MAPHRLGWQVPVRWRWGWPWRWGGGGRRGSGPARAAPPPPSRRCRRGRRVRRPSGRGAAAAGAGAAAKGRAPGEGSREETWWQQAPVQGQAAAAERRRNSRGADGGSGKETRVGRRGRSNAHCNDYPAGFASSSFRFSSEGIWELSRISPTRNREHAHQQRLMRDERHKLGVRRASILSILAVCPCSEPTVGEHTGTALARGWCSLHPEQTPTSNHLSTILGGTHGSVCAARSVASRLAPSPFQQRLPTDLLMVAKQPTV